jgi:hypothetical protein
MKKSMISLLLLVLLLVPVLTVTVSADMGPKPGTSITVRPGGGEYAVVTLLAREESNGPHWTIGPDEEPSSRIAKDERLAQAWYAFRDYRDPDGYHFWGEIYEGSVTWGYFPPENFKIAVYYPEYGILWVSEDSYERYAFDSDFRLNLPAVGAGARTGEVDMVLKKTSNLGSELAGFLFRVVLTLAMELAVARLFGLTEPGQKKLILRVNLLTQVGLNLLLWGWYYFDGPLVAMVRLILAEILVLVVESAIYLRKLRQEESRGKILGYTILANLASVTLGFLFLH